MFIYLYNLSLLVECKERLEGVHLYYLSVYLSIYISIYLYIYLSLEEYGYNITSVKFI